MDNFLGVQTPGSIVVSGGRYVDVVNPKPEQINLVDIAKSLSKLCRFNGHCDHFYSVAEHCCLAAALAHDTGCNVQEMACVLMHDAVEAYVGDMSKPLKVCDDKFQQIESRVELAVEERFNLPIRHYDDLVKGFDLMMLKAEKQFFFPEVTDEWGLERIPNAKVNFRLMAPTNAMACFLNMAEALHLH